MANKINVKLILQLQDAGLSKIRLHPHATCQGILSAMFFISPIRKASAMLMFAVLTTTRSTECFIQTSIRKRPCIGILTTNTCVRNSER